MLSHLLTQLLRSFGIFFRTIRAFFTRRLVGSVGASQAAHQFFAPGHKGGCGFAAVRGGNRKKADLARRLRGNRRLFISKKFLLTIAVGIIVLALLAYFVAWPFILSHFFTAHFLCGGFPY